MSMATEQRKSLTSWWLRIASSSASNLQQTLTERELARRSDLIAWLALGMLGGLVMVSPIAIGDPIAAMAYLCFLALQLAVISLNRAEHITLAGIILVASMNAAIFAYMWSSPLGLTMGQLPNYDAFSVSVVIAASVLPRRSSFVVATLNSVLIMADYLIRPHNANVIADAALYPSVTAQTISLLVRPIALQFVFALIAFLWVRSTDLAIRRADRAEEVALLESRELEHTRTLEEGVRYLHQTLAQWAQGNVTGRVPAMPLEILEQVRNDLNAFIERFGPVTDATNYLRRLQHEVGRFTNALENWVYGRPTVWPESSGTPLDHALELLRPYVSRLPSQPISPPGPSRPTGAPQFRPGTMPPASQRHSDGPRISHTPRPPYMSPPFGPSQQVQPPGPDDAQSGDLGGGTGDQGQGWP